MDLALIGAASAALTAAREIGKAAIGLRDFNQIAGIVSALNDQLLKAQDSLFAHNTHLMALQQEVIESREKLRKMEESLLQRARYSLFEISPRVFVYRVNVAPQMGAVILESPAEPVHYVCQPCLDTKGMRVVLVGGIRHGSVEWDCPICKSSFYGGVVVE